MIQTLLFVAGINTLCQSFFGTRLPAVMGGSYTIVAPTISIIMAGRYSNEADPREVVEFSGNLPPSSRPLFQFLGYSSQGAAHSCAEILADHARNTRRSHHRVDNSDRAWFQWPLAQCR